MAKVYFDKLIDLINKIYPTKYNNKLEIKHFFNGAAVYANGKICITLTPVGLALKLPDENRTKLLKEKGIKSLRYFPKAPIKKDYILLNNSKIKDYRYVKRVIKKSVNYVNSN